MADSDKLWFTVGVRDEVTKELEKMVGKANALQQALEMSKKGKGSNHFKEEYDNARKLENAIFKINQMLSSVYSTKITTSDPEDLKRLFELQMRLGTVRKELEKFKQEIESNPDKLKVGGLVDGFLNKLNFSETLQGTTAYIRETSKANMELVATYDKVAESATRTNTVMNQIKHQFGSIVSLYGAEHLLKSVIQIGGEFEVQHIALQSILGDLQEANTIFNQIKQLAVVSPFNFSELVSFSKQVAAYGIPYEEMYETTKRLADMSAGLGVDMGRLILAYGQVRSAAVLRGQELRQFTEAGIPMVQALADEFTKLKGEVVTTGDVFDLIRKRAVPFEMVKKIMWDMTDEGGRFYNMQFTLADTLAGKWSNLEDAWQIMLSEFAKGESLTGQFLKGAVEATTNLIDNMNKIGPLITGIVASLVGLKLGRSAVNIATLGMSSIDSNIAKAQKLNAIKLREKLIQGEINKAEYQSAIIRNSNTNTWRSQLFLSGRANVLSLTRLDYTKKENRELLKQLLQLGLIDKQMRKMLLNGKNMEFIFKNLGKSISGFGSGLLSALGGWQGILLEVGMSVGTWLVADWIQASNKITEATKESFDSIKQQYEDLHQFLKDNPIEISETNDEKKLLASVEILSNKIREIAPETSSYLLNQILGNDNNGDYGVSYLQQNVAALRNQLEILERAKRLAMDMAGAFDEAAEATDHWNTEGITTNMQDFQNAISEYSKRTRIMSVSDYEELAAQLTAIGDAAKDGNRELTSEEQRIVSIGNQINKMLAQGNTPSAIARYVGTEEAKSRFLAKINAKYAETFDMSDGILAGGLTTRKKDFDNQLKEVYDYIKMKMKEENVKLSSEVGLQAFEVMSKEWMGRMQFSDDLQNYSRLFWDQIMIDEGYVRESMNLPQIVADEMRKLDTEGVIDKMINENDVSTETRDKVKQIYDTATTELGAKFPNLIKMLQKLSDGNPVYIPTVVETSLDDNKRTLTGWRLEMQNYLNGLGLKIEVKPEHDINDVAKLIDDLHKESQTKMDEAGKVIVSVGYKLDDLPEEYPSWLAPWIKSYKDNKDTKEKTEKTKERGIQLSPTKKDTGGSKKDSGLEKLKNKVDLYKKFYSELENARKQYGVNALDYLKENGFKEVFSWEDITDLTNYQKSIDELTNGFKANTEERKKWINGLDADKVSNKLKEDKENLKDYVSELQKMMSVMSENYQTYKKWLDLTGDSELASKVAGVTQNTSYSDYLKDLMKKELNKKENKKLATLTPDDIFKLDMSKTKELVGEGSFIYTIWKEWQDNQNKVRNDQWKLYEEAYNGAKNYDDKIEDINRKLKERIAAVNALARTEEERNRLINNLNENAARDISNIKWDKFKDENDWGDIFGDIENVSLKKLKKLIKAMQDLRKTTNLTVTDMKAWREGMNKAMTAAASKDSLGSMSEALKNYNLAVSKLHEAENAIEYKQMLKNNGADTSGQKSDKELNEDVEKAKNDLLEAKKAIQKLIKAFADDIKTLGSVFGNIGKTIGGSFGDIFSGFGTVFDGVSKSMEAISNIDLTKTGFSGFVNKLQSYVTVFTAVIEMNKMLDSILPSSENMYERYAEEAKKVNNLRAAVDDYRIAVAQAHAEEAEWFAGNDLSALRSKGEKAKEVLSAYFKELYEAQEIYEDKGSGLSKWAVPIVTGLAAIGGVIATIASGGTAAIAILGAMAALETVVGTAGAIAISAAIVAGVGSAVGQIAQSAVEGIIYKDGQIEARKNMRIQTQHSSFWRGEKTENLEEWARENLKDKYGKPVELFDEEGLVNLEAAEQILEKYGNKLVGETQETLQRLVDLRKEYDEFVKQIEEYAGKIGSSLADNMTDALWDWLSDGENALDKFREYASDTWKQIAQDIIKTFWKVTVLDKYADAFKELFKGWSLGQYTDEQLIANVAAISGAISNDMETALPMGEKLVTMLKDMFELQGYDITNQDGGKSSSSSEIKGVTENTAGLIASYLNSVRADTSVNRLTLTQILIAVQAQSDMPVIARAQLQQLQVIAGNTGRNVEIVDSIYNLLHTIAPDGTAWKIR